MPISQTHPLVAEEWHPSLNKLSPDNISFGSNRKVYWLCKHNAKHVWEAKVSDRIRRGGTGCPYCVGKKILVGDNDFASTHPLVAKEWHPTLNDKKASEVTYGSKYKAHWLCPQGHTSQAMVCDRSRGQKCPTCWNERFMINDNLSNLYPDLADLWHPTKNKGLTPSFFGTGSSQKVYWLCKKNTKHEWHARISDVVSSSGCPLCWKESFTHNGRALESSYPLVAREWHAERNKDVLPSEVSRFSSKKVWWLCSTDKTHEWEAAVSDRTSKNSQCPTCSAKKRSSIAEDSIFSFIENMGEEAIQSNRSILNGRELDVYIPKYNIAIEFNGVLWHTEKYKTTPSYHYEKYADCASKNIDLIQIWEDDYKEDSTQILDKIKLRLSSPSKEEIFISYGLSIIDEIITVDNDWGISILLSSYGYEIEDTIEISCSYLERGKRTYKNTGKPEDRIWDSGKTIWRKTKI